MSRYIQEFEIDIGGGILQIPKCAKFLHVAKVGNVFRATAEIWGDPSTKITVEVRVLKRENYIIPELQYMATCVVGNDLFHFFYMPADVLDEGSDGGRPKEERTLVKDAPVVRAGGLKEL